MRPGTAPGAPAGLGAAGAGAGPIGSGRSVSAALAYTRAHGGGTVAVASQSSAAQAIVADDAPVAGIGGFSGRESDVSAAWLASQVSSGRIRWVLVEGGGGGLLGGPPGDTRTGARTAMAAVASACARVQVSGSGAGSGSGASLYDCRGHAAELARLGAV
jgi:hypothetical protein